MIATVLWFLLALGILVTFHEFGHFYIARRCGVKVLRFSVGFGQPLYTWHDRHGTEFVIAAIPLGGYVKMLDEREGEVAAEELPQAFTQKTVWQRMAIVVAGPVANFILAILFYFVLAVLGTKGVVPVIGNVIEQSPAAEARLQANDEIVSIDGKVTRTWSEVFERLTPRLGDTGTINLEVRPFSAYSANTSAHSANTSPYSGSGSSSSQYDSTVTKAIAIDRWLRNDDRPDLLGELGIEPTSPKTNWVISRVVSGGPAEQAGLRKGDQLVAADQQALVDWSEWVTYVRERPQQAILLEFLREDERLSTSIVPEAIEDNGQTVGRVGLGASTQWPEGMVREIDYALPEAIAYGFTKTWDQALVILSFLKKLITLDVSVKNMGGTFTIAEVAGDTAEAGLTYYIAFLAFLSVSLGVFNLLPIPVLDGGHLLFYIIEAIKGRPLPEKIQAIGYQVGLFIVISVMVIAHYNDLVRIFS